MKAYNYLSTIAIGALSMLYACTDGPADHDGGITDSGYITFASPEISISAEGTGSRTTLTTGFNTGDQFNVLGYCVPYAMQAGGLSTNPDWDAASMSWNDKSGQSHADVFYNRTVTITDNGAQYTPIEPWHQKSTSTADAQASWNYRYSFMAYAPAQGAGWSIAAPANATAAGAPRLRFTMPYTPGGTKERLLEHTAIKDALLAAKFDHRRNEGKVKLNFNHILTGLRFRIRNYTNTALIIKSVILDGKFYREADFDFSSTTIKQTTPALSDNYYIGYFSMLESEMTVDGGTQKYVGQDTEAGGTRLLLLHNPLATPSTADNVDNPLYSLGDDKDLTITYRFATDPEGQADREWKNRNFHLSYRPQPNTCYTAQFNFVGDDFVLIFQADNGGVWEDGSDNDIVIQ